MFSLVKRVLIIDDHAVIRRTLSACLYGIGNFDVYEAGDGEDARQLIADRQFDIIFCDINMPNENGIDVLQYLAEQHFSGGVVLISSTDETLLKASSLLARQFNLAIIGVAEKPVQRHTVLSFLIKANQHLAPSEQQQLTPLSATAIAKAIDDANVVAFFQPQVCLKTQQLSGVEALARIENDNGEVFYPSQFIEIAEQSDPLMLALTKAVVTDALAKFAALLAVEPALTLSINISARVLIDQTFPHWLQAICHQYSVPPPRVICELTETALASHPSLLTASILRLRLFQFQLSIDDFGTGYASIEQLHSLPFQELKIDQRFVADCLTDLRSRVVVEQTIQLAKGFGMSVVAEGIESTDVAGFLALKQCDIGQGYFYAKPMRYQQLIDVFGLNKVESP